MTTTWACHCTRTCCYFAGFFVLMTYMTSGIGFAYPAGLEVYLLTELYYPEITSPPCQEIKIKVYDVRKEWGQTNCGLTQRMDVTYMGFLNLASFLIYWRALR